MHLDQFVDIDLGKIEIASKFPEHLEPRLLVLCHFLLPGFLLISGRT